MVALAAVAIFALAACGASGATPSGAAPSGVPTAAADETASPAPTEAPPGATAGGGTVDVCALFSPAELKSVTGKDYGAGVSDTIGGCAWNVGASGVNEGELIYATFQDQSVSFIKTTFADGVDVTVGGHEAYWNPSEGLQSMWVDVDGRLFVLSFPSSETLGPDDQAIAQKLAEIAVGKM
jgi:hypothetical protein